MKEFIAKSLIHLLPKSIIFRIQLPLKTKLAELNESYSQNGEDIILRRLFQGTSNGFFVDIGAHHPIRFSNTYSLYKQGWRGVNIDAMPGSMKIFDEVRPGDKNVEIGVSDKEQTLTFYAFNEPALNTFSKEEADKKNGKNGYHITQTVKIQTLPLSALLERYIPSDVSIDYLNIDIEGLDMLALRSNNWNKFRPSVISVESYFSSGSIKESEVYEFLSDHGYQLVSVLFNTLIFATNDISANSVIRL